MLKKAHLPRVLSSIIAVLFRSWFGAAVAMELSSLSRENLGKVRWFSIYPVHVMTRKSFGLMTRKLSVTQSQRSAQFRGTVSRRKPSVASANWAHVA